jgi:hypothetical protein
VKVSAKDRFLLTPSAVFSPRGGWGFFKKGESQPRSYKAVDVVIFTTAKVSSAPSESDAHSKFKQLYGSAKPLLQL